MNEPRIEPDSEQQATVLRVREPGDLIETIPYLLGFHPRASLVLVGLDNNRVIVTARADLSAVAADPTTLATTVRAVVQGGSSSVVSVVYDDAEDDSSDDAPRVPLPHQPLVADIRELAAEAGAPILDALLVRSGRWWSYVCTDEHCCPAQGRVRAGQSSRAAATATYAGLVALPDRSDVIAMLAPDDDAARWAMLPELQAAEDRAFQAVLFGRGKRHERSVKRAMFAAARDADATLFVAIGGGQLSDSDVARYATALADTAIRDAVWLAIDQDRLDGRALWRDIARRVPPPYDAAALFLFGWAEWRGGNCPLAGVAAERALLSDPTYTAANLLLGALTNGLDPRRTPRLRMPRSA